MSATLKEIEQQVYALSAEERARLAQVLLESLQESPLADIEAAWEREIEERVSLTQNDARYLAENTHLGRCWIISARFFLVPEVIQIVEKGDASSA